MTQYLYCEKYVDHIGVINSAKVCKLDMQEVEKRYCACGNNADSLWDWKEWVYAEIQKVKPGFIDWRSVRNRLNSLDANTDELELEFAEAMSDLYNNDELVAWVKKAEVAIAVAAKKKREETALTGTF